MHKKWVSGQELLEMGFAPFEIFEAIKKGVLNPVNPKDGNKLAIGPPSPPYLVPDDGFVGRFSFQPRAMNPQRNAEYDVCFYGDSGEVVSIGDVLFPSSEVLKMCNEFADNPDEIVKNMRLAGEEDDSIIAFEVKKYFPKLTDSEIGELLPDDPERKIDKEGRRSRGQRLLGKKQKKQLRPLCAPSAPRPRPATTH